MTAVNTVTLSVNASYWSGRPTVLEDVPSFFVAPQWELEHVINEAKRVVRIEGDDFYFCRATADAYAPVLVLFGRNLRRHLGTDQQLVIDGRLHDVLAVNLSRAPSGVLVAGRGFRAPRPAALAFDHFRAAPELPA